MPGLAERELLKHASHWVARAAEQEGEPPSEPVVVRARAAVMMADVSGFTALAERLAAQGPEGAETLWRVVNAFFGDTVDLIQAHGGDVLRFAGDAPIVLWTEDEGMSLEEATRRATACGLALQEQLGAYDTGENAIVRFRVGIAAGDVLIARIGGVEGRWEALVGGVPFEGMALALEDARVGEVVLTGEAAQLVSYLDGEELSSGCLRLTRLADGVAPDPRPLAEQPDARPEALRPFVSRGVRERIEAGHSGWLGELRSVVSLFLAIDGLDYQATDVGGRMHRLLRSLQEVVYQYEGAVNQFLVDDKGTVLLAAWGLPTTTHEDDAVRAVRAGEALLDALGRHGLGGRVGITVGRVFCGVKGNARRSEYGLLGASVNLAARLMQRADGEVLCDLSAERAARSAVAFEALPDVVVKGRKGRVRVFRPKPMESTESRPAIRLIGREVERAAVTGLLDRLADSGRGGVVLLEGEAGIGKSVLVDEILRLALGRGLLARLGAADAIESQTPFYVFRAVFEAILGLDPTAAPAARTDAARAWFAAHPELEPVAPLFNPVLKLSLPETEVTAPMEGEARVERTRAALVDALGAAGPVTLVLDDLHWFDSASWELSRIAMRELDQVLFVFTTRPPTEISDQLYDQIRAVKGLVHLRLDPLPAEDMARLVCDQLGCRSLPREVEEVIQARAEGHPFYASELALAMLEQGLIQVVDGECGLAPDAGDLSGVELPPTLEGVIAARLDLLSPIELLSLKTASVIGRVFRQDMLQDLYPVGDQREEVPKALSEVKRRDLTQVETPDPELAYLFKHVITQQVAYDQLLFEQRRSLHAEAASWYEAGHAGAVAPYFPLIAHHWQRAEDAARAIDALEAAGQQAFDSFAHREAIAFLTAAQAIDAGAPSPSSAERRGRWARLLGEACSHLGRTEEGLAHMKRAVALLGHPLPGNGLTVGLGLLAQAAVQVWRRWVGAPGVRAEGREQALMAVNCLAEMSLLAYYHGDVGLTLYAALRSLNLAESYGPSSELARMKAAFAHVVIGLPLHGAARNYSLEAVETAERFDDGLSTARAHQYRGALLIALGQWEGIQEHADRAMAASKAIGHGRGMEEALNLQVYRDLGLGENERAFETAAEMERSARWREDAQVVFWAQLHQADARWRQGRVSEARELLESMDDGSQTDNTILLRYHGLCVHTLLDDYRLEEALAVAEAHLLPQQRATSFIEQHAYTAVPALQLARWERDGPGGGVQKAARAAGGQLNTFAQLFPLGRSAALFYEGRRRCLEGRLDKGRQRLEECLAHATGAGERFEQMLAHEAIAELGVIEDGPHRSEAARLRAELSGRK